MTNEELNTALYKKMFAEQDEYKKWLIEQPAEEILRNAYDYVMREDILLSLEYNDLSDRYATVLLNMDEPLAAIFTKLEHTETEHMDHVWDSVMQCACDALESQQEAEKLKTLPVYPHSATYAHEHGELVEYRASHQANIACRDAIDAAVREHYRNNRLDFAAVEQVAERFGLERTLHVLAVTVRHKDWDGRISSDHKTWAKAMPIPDDKDAFGNDHTLAYVVDQTHPGLVNLFVTKARRMEKEQQPSIHQQLRQKTDAPTPKSPVRKEPER